MGHNVSSTKNSSQTIHVHNVDNSEHNNANNDNLNGIECDFKSVTQLNVKTSDDDRMCDISGCYVYGPSVILVTDFTNKKLKKCSNDKSVLSLVLPCSPADVCNIGDNNNQVVVSGDSMLCFVNISDKMKITRTVNLKHKCHGISCHNETLYVVDDNSVYVYTLKGKKVHTIFRHESPVTKFCRIKVNAQGTLVYVSDENSGLFTVHTSGDLVSVYFDEELKEAQGLCVMDNGHVLVSGFQSDNVIEVDKNGGKKIKTFIKDAGYIHDPKCLYFDRQTRELYVGQWNDTLSIFKLL